MISLRICQHLQNASGQMFVDFGVSVCRGTGWDIFVTGL